MSVYDRWHKSEKQPDGSVKTVRSASYGKGMRWQVRWYDADGIQQKKNFPKKSGDDPEIHASAYDAKIKRDLDTGAYVAPAEGKRTFREYAEEWRKDQIHRPATADLVERSLRLHVYPSLGGMQLAQVRPTRIQRWVREQSESLAPSTLSVVYGYIASIFLAAVRDRVIAHTPCVGIKLPQVKSRNVEVLDAATVTAIADALPRRYRAVVLAAAGTGLRPGELFGLEVRHVDFLRRTLRVEQQMITAGDKHVAYLGPPKTVQSERTIPLSQSVVDMLAAHLAEFPAVTVDIEDRTDPRKPKTRPAELLFTTPKKEPIRRRAWSEVWAPVARKAGLAPRTGLHIARHTFASGLIRYGESVKTVQHLMGHTSPAITLNVYSHLWPDSEDRARAAIDAMWSDVPSMCPASEG